jgi:succinate dehydrogenase / fumarate reductase cytochrome b subunit
MSDKKTFLKTTIGQKVLMAATGLSLVGFLTSHLVGNFLLFDGIGGQDAFNKYAHWLTSHPAIKPMEIGLVALFVIHIALAIKVTLAAKAARPEKYAVSDNLGESTFASRTMIHTGGIIFIFLILHLVTFKYGSNYDAGGVSYTEKVALKKAGKTDKEIESKNKAMLLLVTAKKTELMKKAGDSDKIIATSMSNVRDLYSTVREMFAMKWYSLLYIVCMIGLGIHLCHGIRSAFQTFGINHPKYNVCIQRVSCILAITFALGYSIFPIYFGFIAK